MGYCLSDKALEELVDDNYTMLLGEDNVTYGYTDFAALEKKQEFYRWYAERLGELIRADKIKATKIKIKENEKELATLKREEQIIEAEEWSARNERKIK